MDKKIVVYEGEKDVRLEVKTDGETIGKGGYFGITDIVPRR
jgi:hypothetical protein